MVAAVDAHRSFFAITVHGNEQTIVELYLHFGSAHNWTMDPLGDLRSAKNRVGSINKVLVHASMDESVALRTNAVQKFVEIGSVEMPTTAKWIEV